MGIFGRIMLFSVVAIRLICSTEKMGYECSTHGDYIFYVSGWRNPWRDAFVIKKCF